MPYGQGQGNGRGGQYGGRGSGAGPAGQCVCPQCGHKIDHQRGVPCTSVPCPQCGSQMMRA